MSALLASDPDPEGTDVAQAHGEGSSCSASATRSAAIPSRMTPTSVDRPMAAAPPLVAATASSSVMPRAAAPSPITSGMDGLA